MVSACVADVTIACDDPGSDASIFEPVPVSIRRGLNIQDPSIHQSWMKSYRKECITLLNALTFIIDYLLPGKKCIPVLDLNRVKINSDGTLDKLKARIFVQGDLQSADLLEDKWSPTASFCALKMFLAHAARLRARVKKLDFIGTFLQANVQSRIFINFPTNYSKILPEYKQYFGGPLRLNKSKYGMTLSGKFWYLELMEALFNMGFVQSPTIKCLFFKLFPDGSSI